MFSYSFNMSVYAESIPYENFDMGIRMTYPSDWNVTEDNYLNKITFSPIDEYTSFDKHRTKDISFEISYIFDKTASLSKTVNQTISNYNDDNYYYSNFTLLDRNDTDWLKQQQYQPSVMLNYSYIDDDTLVNNTQIITIYNDRVYHIEYSAKEPFYTTDLAYIKNIANSINFFDVKRYEKVFDNYSGGLIFKYPDKSDWEINEISHNKLSFLNLEGTKNRFTLSYFYFNNDSKDLRNIILKNLRNISSTIMNTEEIYLTTTSNNLSKGYSDLIEVIKNEEGNTHNIVQNLIYTVFNNTAYVFNYTGNDLYLRDKNIETFLNKYFRIIEFPSYNYNNITFREISLSVPLHWSLSQDNVTIIKDRTREEIDFSIIRYPIGTNSLYDLINADINFYKSTNEAFEIIDSFESTLSNNPSHDIISSYKDGKNTYKSLTRYSIIGPKGQNIYVVNYNTLEDNYTSYLPTINRTLSSIKIQEDVYQTDKTGIPIGGSPVDIAINNVTNKIYVAVPESRSIQVIDGKTERIIDNITIGAFPNAIAVSSVTNRIYVASPESDILYIIDGLTNNITHKIRLGEYLGDIAIDSNEFGGYRELVFVVSIGNNMAYVIDSTTGEIKSNIKMHSSPRGIAIDSIKNRAYVTTEFGIEGIDYYTEFFGKKVYLTHFSIPYFDSYSTFGITVDPTSSRVYVADEGIDKVYVIDTNSNYVIGQIQVGLFPRNIAFNEENKKLYIGTDQGYVYIIDTKRDNFYSKTKSEPSKPIKVDSIPYDIAINPSTNMIYLANYESETISLIDGDTDNRTTSLLFRIFPSNAGRIVCNNEIQSPDTDIKMAVDTKCNIIAEPGFAYSTLHNDSKVHSHYTINYNTTSHLHNIYDNTIAHLFNNTLGPPNITPIPIDHYGSYTFNLISFPAIINSASIFLSFGTLLIVIFLAILKSVFDNRGKSDKKHKITLYYLNPEDEEEQIDKQKDNVFSKSEIIGFDVAVIAGILIFLTISEGFGSDEQLQISMITATIVFPFAISAVFAITDKIGFSTRLMVAGFINLMIAVLLMAIMKIYQ